MEHNVYIYIALMSAVTLAIRILPLTLIKRQIKNPFLRAFLYYVPYVTLAVMTFPAIIKTTATPLPGAVALIVGIVLSWLNASLFMVAAATCLAAMVISVL